MKIEYKSIKHPKTELEAMQTCERIVRSRAIKMSKGHPQSYEDLIQQGYIGVLAAYKDFDATRSKAAFATYAFTRVWHHCKEYATEMWKRDNSECEYQLEKHGNDYYELDTDGMDYDKIIGKLDDTQRKVFEMRMEGETFDVIAERLNITNLQKARKIYIAVENKMKI